MGNSVSLRDHERQDMEVLFHRSSNSPDAAHESLDTFFRAIRHESSAVDYGSSSSSSSSSAVLDQTRSSGGTTTVHDNGDDSEIRMMVMMKTEKNRKTRGHTASFFPDNGTYFDDYSNGDTLDDDR